MKMKNQTRKGETNQSNYLPSMTAKNGKRKRNGASVLEKQRGPETVLKVMRIEEQVAI